MASRREPGAAAAAPVEIPVKQVQIDGLVVLKIIKHYQEEGHGSEVVQGVLLGLVVDDRLEITNCFPFPQHTEDDAEFDEDPIKTSQGSLSLKAYRLTPKLMEVCKEKDFSAEGNHLEKSLQLLMDRVDEMSQDIVKYNTFLRNASKQTQQKHQYVQRRQQENIQRQSRGEPPLPEEDVSKLFKPPLPPPRMDSLLIAGQIDKYIQNVKECTSQNLGKLFMAEALQDQVN
ncbi:hypothetical protein GDO81_011157 [Engystomops pustulosus]|uniref:JAB1/MPN/MOV34 metalloenzyme domain-containing protein n=1 Tax=Engystomops pustulosus TaxID=76066 RepID=A0AAV7BCA0_ENGPU|nr:hypothetical protein GDO81_011157 [Engystomops pustulosus]